MNPSPQSSKSKKSKVVDKASQFLSMIGTAGGPIGSPSLIGFGPSNLAEQVQYGMSDNYARQRMAGDQPIVGSPAPQMPMDLDAGYLRLNMPGSPLPMHGLMTSHNLRAAQIAQDQMTAQEQMVLLGMMPQRGQLPVGQMPIQQPMQKGSR